MRRPTLRGGRGELFVAPSARLRNGFDLHLGATTTNAGSTCSDPQLIHKIGQRAWLVYDDQGEGHMNKKRTAVMIMAAFFTIGAAQLIGAGSAAAAPLNGAGVSSIYPDQDPIDCDTHPHHCR